MTLKPLINRVYGTFLSWAKGFALALALVALSAGPAFSAGAVETIDEFHGQLIQVMQNSGEWDYTKRRDFLSGPVRETFNANLMVRLASGQYWKNFSQQQQKALSEAFLEFTLSNYASRFKGYSGQEFVTDGLENMRGKRVLVKTRLLNNGDEIVLNYVMYPDGGGNYRVIDVYQRGAVSELAIRKSEFSPILRDQGFTGLLSLLKQKVENLEKEALNPS